MYPWIRLGTELARHRRAAPLAVGDWHVTSLRVLPVDIDPWGELNNGRALTLFDLGRVVLFARSGFLPVMRRRRWSGSIAGTSIRYRRRLTLGQRVEMRARILGWDDRFSYAEQSFWRADGECAAHALLRMAVAAKGGIVPREAQEAAFGLDPSPPLPGWVRAWIAADAERPWPPGR